MHIKENKVWSLAAWEKRKLIRRKRLGQCYLIGLSLMMEVFSKSGLSSMVASSHMWLLSTWNVASSTKDVDFKLYLGLITLNLKFSVFKGVLGITTISLKKGRKQPGVTLRTQDCFGVFRSKSGGFFRVAVTVTQMLICVYQIKMTTPRERQSDCLSLGLASTLKSIS